MCQDKELNVTNKISKKNASNGDLGLPPNNFFSVIVRTIAILPSTLNLTLKKTNKIFLYVTKRLFVSWTCLIQGQDEHH